MKNPLLLAVAVLLAVFFIFCPSDTYAKDEWKRVRSPNFVLIGNASEKEIKRVANKVEQFRDAFRTLFPLASHISSRPTNVVVFKSAGSYKPFKPQRSDGKPDVGVAGYFQPGEDVNYITLSTEGDDDDVYGTIFHEYVHFIIENNFGRSDIPTWFNEGLAEYYQTFRVIEDQKVRLGLPQSGHLYFLRNAQLIPLETLFRMSNRQLHNSGNTTRQIFYAQSWALMHYMTHSGKADALGKFLSTVSKGGDQKAHFETAFGTTYPEMEKVLRKYIGQAKFDYTEVTFKKKLFFEDKMTVEPLDESTANSYLGDLLYHTNRPDDAEPLLASALKTDPGSSFANTSMGMVKIRQRKFADARNYLEKAIASDARNHIAYYRYAYLLSREGRDEFGNISQLEPAVVEKIRESLKKAIGLNPAFGESYDMLGYIALLSNDGIEDATIQIRVALKYEPGNEKYALRLAELLARQKKFNDARIVAQNLAERTDDAEIRERAERLKSFVDMQEEYGKRRDEIKTAGTTGSGDRRPMIIRGNESPKLSEAELERRAEMASLRGINEILRKPVDGEQRLIGRIEKIDCRKRPLAFVVRDGERSITLTSKDFESLEMNAFVQDANDLQVGCDASLSQFNAILTFKPSTKTGDDPAGELVAIEFVPSNFRFLTAEEIKGSTTSTYETPPSSDESDDGPPPPKAIDAAEVAKRRREAAFISLRNSLPKPTTDEVQFVGFLDRIECNDKGGFFHFRTEGGKLKLLSDRSAPPNIIVYTQDLAGVQFGCTLKPIEFPAVVIYSTKEKKNKSDGIVRSISFVPIGFTLTP